MPKGRCTCEETNGVSCYEHGRTAPQQPRRFPTSEAQLPDIPFAELRAAVREQYPEDEYPCLSIHSYAIRGDESWEQDAADYWEENRCCGWDQVYVTVDGFQYWVGVSYGH